MLEVWRVVPVDLDPLGRYEVSSLGRVRRLWPHTDPRLLKPYVGRHNYPKVQLGYRGSRVYVHTLVALTFLGPRPPGEHVDHIDFDRQNNEVDNLRYLPAVINSVRWAGRAYGRNLWMLTADEPAPDSHEAMTSEERDAYQRDTKEAGW